MFLKSISDQNIHSEFIQLVASERELLHKVLEYIKELDRRKLYLKFGYANLFTYLTEACGYSAGSAQRRIHGARLLAEIPEISEKLQSGELNLSHVNLVAQANRQKSKQTGKKMDRETKKQLLEKLCHKNKTHSEILIAQTLDMPLLEVSKQTHQKDESVRLELTLTKEQWQKLESLRILLSHKVPTGDWDQILEYLADKVIFAEAKKAKDYNKPAPITEVSSEKATKGFNPTVKASHEISMTKKSIQTLSSHRQATPPNFTSTVEVKSENNRYISSQTKKIVFQKAKHRCQYKSPFNQKTCESQWQLQIDHIRPIWADGLNHIDNLQVLCANHNREKYRLETGVKSL